ncbi:enoyl-CoA hydratase/isomerase family protein [Polaribacter vadi]|uniref:enoyl-CoA hydratase/isomerase family protein n=1 Tax=Polaribacter TaxID=52959 RepID=UPI001C081F4A|nr:MULTISPECIES: enoyl-CoA hydratase/isomerase family protein [Polaribacter]MBU3010493.1 enoyl-CoA hydratase/isomerase family protein [Polaribacter vadi]MDO6740301.1 enoyl-CoA hydratase/isomerase family protein [Polaribacter sp. 1_MG-2023]
MITTRQNGSLFTNIQNNIATIEFGHPASNSFPSELLERLTKELKKLSLNDEVALIILKSEGEKAFCAGASFNELVAIANLEDGEKFFTGFANVINAMRTCSKLIIGRVQGKVVGGGVGLASACDYVLATEAASIKLSELTIGIGPFVIEPAVTRKIGLAATSELTLDATSWKNAYWAKEKGLYAKVFENIKELDIEVDLFAQKLASYNPSALAKMKKVLWQNTNHWDNLLIERAKISGELVLSEFTKNTLARFSKK